MTQSSQFFRFVRQAMAEAVVLALLMLVVAKIWLDPEFTLGHAAALVGLTIVWLWQRGGDRTIHPMAQLPPPTLPPLPPETERSTVAPLAETTSGLGIDPPVSAQPTLLPAIPDPLDSADRHGIELPRTELPASELTMPELTAVPLLSQQAREVLVCVAPNREEPTQIQTAEMLPSEPRPAETLQVDAQIIENGPIENGPVQSSPAMDGPLEVHPGVVPGVSTESRVDGGQQDEQRASADASSLPWLAGSARTTLVQLLREHAQPQTLTAGIRRDLAALHAADLICWRSPLPARPNGRVELSHFVQLTELGALVGAELGGSVATQGSLPRGMGGQP